MNKVDDVAEVVRSLNFKHKKTGRSRFFEIHNVNINVLKIVAFYEPCVNQLSYVQLYEHHE